MLKLLLSISWKVLSRFCLGEEDEDEEDEEDDEEEDEDEDAEEKDGGL